MHLKKIYLRYNVTLSVYQNLWFYVDNKFETKTFSGT